MTQRMASETSHLHIALMNKQLVNDTDDSSLISRASEILPIIGNIRSLLNVALSDYTNLTVEEHEKLFKILKRANKKSKQQKRGKQSMKSLVPLNNNTLEHAPFQQTCGELFVVGNEYPLTIKKKKKKERKVVEKKREPSLSPKAVRNMLHEFVRRCQSFIETNGHSAKSIEQLLEIPIIQRNVDTFYKYYPLKMHFMRLVTRNKQRHLAEGENGISLKRIIKFARMQRIKNRQFRLQKIEWTDYEDEPEENAIQNIEDDQENCVDDIVDVDDNNGSPLLPRWRYTDFTSQFSRF